MPTLPRRAAADVQGIQPGAWIQIRPERLADGQIIPVLNPRPPHHIVVVTRIIAIVPQIERVPDLMSERLGRRGGHTDEIWSAGDTVYAAERGVVHINLVSMEYSRIPFHGSGAAQLCVHDLLECVSYVVNLDRIVDDAFRELEADAGIVGIVELDGPRPMSLRILLEIRPHRRRRIGEPDRYRDDEHVGKVDLSDFVCSICPGWLNWRDEREAVVVGQHDDLRGASTHGDEVLRAHLRQGAVHVIVQTARATAPVDHDDDAIVTVVAQQLDGVIPGLRRAGCA